MEIQYKALVGTGYHTPREVQDRINEVNRLITANHPDLSQHHPWYSELDFLLDLLDEINEED